MNYEGCWQLKRIVNYLHRLTKRLILYCIQYYRHEFRILDVVNASIDHIKDSIELVERYGYKIVYFQMQTSLEQCLENNLCRPAYSRASEEKIRKFHEMIETTELLYERIYSL